MLGDAFTTSLLAWYRAFHRKLPWRNDPTPYRVWVSEIMLQQTRVDTAASYFGEFVRRWPTVEALGNADPDELLQVWAGLGYYRRVRHMHNAAKTMVKDHDARVPSTVEELLRLPGLGRYTAGAVASIAFDRPVAAVDGNVARVVMRIDGIDARANDPVARARVWEIADALARRVGGSTWTQALMELGALVCTPRSPRCDACPVARWCCAKRTGRTNEIPARSLRPTVRRMRLTAIVAITSRGHVLLHHRGENGLFSGLWCVPLFDRHRSPASLGDVSMTLDSCVFAIPLEDPVTVGVVEHALTHRQLIVKVVRGRFVKPRRLPDGVACVAPRALAEYGLPTLAKKILRVASVDLSTDPSPRSYARR